MFRRQRRKCRTEVESRKRGHIFYTAGGNGGQSEIDSDYFPSYIRFVDSENLSFPFVNAFLLLLFKLQ